MFLETDKFDRLLYRDMREVNPGIPELEDAGKEKLKVWPETVSDIWSGLFKADPKMAEELRAEAVAKIERKPVEPVESWAARMDAGEDTEKLLSEILAKMQAKRLARQS